MGATPLPNCAVFDGATAYLQSVVSAAYAPPLPIGVRVWIKVGAPLLSGGVMAICDCVAGGAGWGLQRFNGLSLRTNAGHTEIGSLAVPPSAAWQLLHAGVDATGHLTAYLNGVSVGSAVAGVGAIANPSAAFYLGCRPTLANFFLGSMAGFRLFNAGISAAQALQDYNTGLTGLETSNLVLDWPLQGDGPPASNNGPSATQYDRSGNNITATVHGSLVWSYGTGPQQLPDWYS